MLTSTLKPAMTFDQWRSACSSYFEGQRVCEVSPRVKMPLPCGCGPDEEGKLWVVQVHGDWYCAMTPRHRLNPGHCLYLAPASQHEILA